MVLLSGSTSASYAARSGSLGSTSALERTYYGTALSASFDDCACEVKGAQGRIFFRIEADDFFIATQSRHALLTEMEIN